MMTWCTSTGSLVYFPLENLSGGAQMNYVGIDYHRQSSHITLLDERGEVAKSVPSIYAAPPAMKCTGDKDNGLKRTAGVLL
jgi:hypothetical protein